MNNKQKADPNENAKIGAAAVGGAIVGAAGAVLATKALSNPKTKKKIQGAWNQVKDGAMDAIEDIKNKASELGEESKKKLDKS